MPALRELIPIRQFSSGRRVVVYDRVREVAERRALTRIVEHIDRALAHEHRTRTLENRWSSRDTRLLHPERLPALDHRVDQVLASIHAIARAQARGLPAHHPTVAQVAELVAEIFPHGVQAVIALPYVDQALATETILAKLHNGMAATARALGLQARVELLAEMAAEYRRLIDAGRDTVDYRSVREARERGQQYLRELIAMILGMFPDSEVAGHVDAREELLAPVLSQLDVLRAQARARRRGRRGVDGADGEDGEDGDITPERADGDSAHADGFAPAPAIAPAIRPASGEATGEAVAAVRAGDAARA